MFGQRIQLGVTGHDDVARVILALTSPAPVREATQEAMVRCVSWPLVFRLAEQHRVTGQIAGQIWRMGLAGALPAAFRTHVERVRQRAKLKDACFAMFLSKILETMKEAGIPAMLLKGQSLAERLYAEPCDRDSADIDIIVPRGARGEAIGVLGALGYRPKNLERYSKEHFHVPLENTEKQYYPILELHWDVTRPGYPIQFDIQRWWHDAKTLQLRAGPVLIPPPDEEFVHLAWHALSMGSVTLRALSDISRLLLRCNGPDLAGSVGQVCSRSGAGGFLLMALSLCRQYWESDSRFPLRMNSGSRRRLSMARTLLNPKRMMFAPGDPWWPYVAICVWSLTPPNRSNLLDLFRRAIRDVSAYQATARPVTAFLRGGKVVGALAVGLLAARLQGGRLNSWDATIPNGGTP